MSEIRYRLNHRNSSSTPRQVNYKFLNFHTTILWQIREYGSVGSYIHPIATIIKQLDILQFSIAVTHYIVSYYILFYRTIFGNYHQFGAIHFTICYSHELMFIRFLIGNNRSGIYRTPINNGSIGVIEQSHIYKFSVKGDIAQSSIISLCLNKRHIIYSSIGIIRRNDNDFRQALESRRRKNNLLSGITFRVSNSRSTNGIHIHYVVISGNVRIETIDQGTIQINCIKF